MSKINLTIIIFSIANLASGVQGDLEHADVKLWRGSTFHQKTVNVNEKDKDEVRAKIDGKWKRFHIRELPDKFMKWNIDRRLETLNRIRNGEVPSLSGPHNAMVASHGVKRYDTEFTINNAVKGVGFLPKEEKLDEVINILNTTIDSAMGKKLETLENLYRDWDVTFDRTKQVSLELYTEPEFETHTFLNEMVNPEVAIVFLDIPSFELKAVSQLLHPDDPALTEYQKSIIEYVNLIHSYFHGKFPHPFITVIYHIIEVYDNSPGKGGKGVRIVPIP